MANIKIIYYQTGLHQYEHIAAVVVGGKEPILVEFIPGKTDKKARIRQLLDQQDQSGDCLDGEGAIKTLWLESNKNCEEYEIQFAKKFNDIASYSVCNNCADAVKFTLRYFFPSCSYLVAVPYTLYQLLGCTFSVICIGASCLPCLPCVTVPADVYNQAYLVSCNCSGKVDESKPLLETSAQDSRKNHL